MNDEFVRALILKSSDYREYDAILTILTKEYGKLSLRAGGIRKASSRNRGSVLSCTEAEVQFHYQYGRTMFRLYTAHTVHLYRHLHEDLEAGTTAEAVGLIADHFTIDGDAPGTENMYDAVEKAWQLLDQKEAPAMVLCLFMADVMQTAGIAPDVDACVHDGRRSITAISVHDGGFLCAECAEREGIPSSDRQDLYLFRLICKGGLQHFEEIRKVPGNYGYCLRILEEMICLYGSMKADSFRLVNRILCIE